MVNIYDKDSRVVYTVCCYLTVRHMKPHTTMSYLKPEDTLWAFGRRDGDTRIIMEVVDKDSSQYMTAMNNSFGNYPAVTDEYLELRHLLEPPLSTNTSLPF